MGRPDLLVFYGETALGRPNLLVLHARRSSVFLWENHQVFLAGRSSALLYQKNLLVGYYVKTYGSSKRQPYGFYTNTFLPSVRSVCDLLYKDLVAFYAKKDCRTFYEDLRVFSTQIFGYSMRRLSSLLWEKLQVFVSPRLQYECLLDFHTKKKSEGQNFWPLIRRYLPSISKEDNLIFC